MALMNLRKFSGEISKQRRDDRINLCQSDIKVSVVINTYNK